PRQFHSGAPPPPRNRSPHERRRIQTTTRRLPLFGTELLPSRRNVRSRSRRGLPLRSAGRTESADHSKSPASLGAAPGNSSARRSTPDLVDPRSHQADRDESRSAARRGTTPHSQRAV